MKLAISNIAIPDSEKHGVYALLHSLGYTGLEIAPTKLIGAQPYDNLAQAKEAAQELEREYGLCIASMQSIWFGQQGNIFEPQDAKQLCSYTKKAIAFAKEINCKSMVFGCPKNRNMPQGKNENDAISFFSEIAEFAKKNNTAIALEANVPQYGTNFINTSAQAFELAKKIPHLKVNYDFGTVIANDESLKALEENLALVSHIHISEPQLAPIQKRKEHKALAELLRAHSYGGYVSIEMKEANSKELAEILKYVAEVFI